MNIFVLNNVRLCRISFDVCTMFSLLSKCSFFLPLGTVIIILDPKHVFIMYVFSVQ
jgi:hypothetical protein